MKEVGRLTVEIKHGHKTEEHQTPILPGNYKYHSCLLFLWISFPKSKEVLKGTQRGMYCFSLQDTSRKIYSKRCLTLPPTGKNYLFPFFSPLTEPHSTLQG